MLVIKVEMHFTFLLVLDTWKCCLLVYVVRRSSKQDNMMVTHGLGSQCEVQRCGGCGYIYSMCMIIDM